MLQRISFIAALLVSTGCINRPNYTYTYPDYPYYTADDSCGSSASAAECAWAKNQVQRVAEETSAATWGSAVALTLLASIDVEPER